MRGLGSVMLAPIGAGRDDADHPSGKVLTSSPLRFGSAEVDIGRLLARHDLTRTRHLRGRARANVP
jgi:hypothetical protein